MHILKFYLVYVSLGLLATLVIMSILKNKDKNQIKKFLFMLSILALISHLVKPFFFPYNIRPFPDILRKITFENICAVSALIYPFVLLFNKKIALDYISTLGMIGGLAAFLYPTEVILNDFDSMKVNYEIGLFAFDTIRFYFVHYIIFIVPFLLLYYKIHVLDIKRAIFLPISIILVLALIYVNEIGLEQLGWLREVHEYSGRNIFYDRNIRNSSFVFGISDSFKGIGVIVDFFVPKILREPNYMPVLWITIPAFVYGILIYLIVAYMSNANKTKKDIKIFIKKLIK